MAVDTQRVFQEKRLALAQTQVKLDFFQTSNEEQEILQSQIDEAALERDQILESYGGLRLSWEYWSPALKQIQEALPEGIALSYLSRQEDAYRLEGISSQYQLVVALSDSLAEIPVLDQVQIDSIEQIDEEEASTLPPLSLAETGLEETESEEPAVEPIYYAFTILFNAGEEVEP
jgi:Tfp pilus assembly protein PilN